MPAHGHYRPKQTLIISRRDARFREQEHFEMNRCFTFLPIDFSSTNQYCEVYFAKNIHPFGKSTCFYKLNKF